MSKKLEGFEFFFSCIRGLTAVASAERGMRRGAVVSSHRPIVPTAAGFHRTYTTLTWRRLKRRANSHRLIAGTHTVGGVCENRDEKRYQKRFTLPSNSCIARNSVYTSDNVTGPFTLPDSIHIQWLWRDYISR